MFFVGTKSRVADNSGAKIAECIKILGSKKIGKIGDIIIVSIKSLRKGLTNSKVAKGSIHRAIILRTKKEFRRKDGTLISFDETAITLFKREGQPLSTRLFGPVLEDLRLAKDLKVLSLASSSL